MAPKTQTLTVKRVIDATPAEAYRAFASSFALREWFCDAAQLEARKGGRLYAWWNSGYFAAGEFFAVTPDKKIAFTWQGRGEPAETRVQITFAPAKGGTRVTVVHSGIWSGRQWAEAVAMFQHGWEVALTNLQSILETGQDLRFVRRPMLGINLGEFNAAAAARLGVPTAEGVLVDNTLAGMGAQAAGLQKNDVIVKIGRRKLTGWTAIGAVLQTYQGGDRVAVTYYRGPEKRVAIMELSRRPLPEVPPTPAGLAEALGKIYAESQAALAGCLQGVTEAEASAKPGPGEWSAKETIAHLLTGERDLQYWIGGLVSSTENPDFLENLDSRYAAAASVYPLAAMLEAMKLAQAETVAFVAALPPEFVARKGSYQRMGFNLLQPDTHTLEHLEQIQAAVRKARGG